MNAKKILTVVLLIFVAGSLGYLLVGKTGRSTNEESITPIAAEEIELPDHQVKAYYFHWTARCKTCLKIEKYTKEVFDSNFAEFLTSGEITWQAVNVEEPANEHFVKDYKLTSSSLVLVNMYNEKQTEWKNLKRVWKLAGDKAAFITYVRDETRDYLQGEG